MSELIRPQSNGPTLPSRLERRITTDIERTTRIKGKQIEADLALAGHTMAVAKELRTMKDAMAGDDVTLKMFFDEIEAIAHHKAATTIVGPSLTDRMGL